LASVIERNIDPRRVVPHQRSIEEFQQDAEYLALHECELLRDYGNEWIAILRREVVAHSPDSKEFDRQLRAKGLIGHSPLVQFMSTENLTLIFPATL
jgi:hypothetical protein